MNLTSLNHQILGLAALYITELKKAYNPPKFRLRNLKTISII